MNASRTYTQTKRADETELTRRTIIDAAQSLFREEHELDPSLEQVAAVAGCSTRSIIRHFGSKNGLLEAAVADGTEAVAEGRRAEPGDVEGAIRTLVDHYEQLGDEVIGWLGSESRFPLVKRVVEKGTEMHLEWVDEVFAPELGSLSRPARRSRRAVLASITDVHFWNLLRRREGLGREATEKAILELIR
jgi:AcrR family transcriptional regulator